MAQLPNLKGVIELVDPWAQSHKPGCQRLPIFATASDTASESTTTLFPCLGHTFLPKDILIPYSIIHGEDRKSSSWIQQYFLLNHENAPVPV
jgi:hypothetical protein